jgi:hypothetical protein
VRTAQPDVAKVSSAGTARTTELSSMAPIERTTVSSEMIAMGTPYCTERLMVPTSRVTRVTRSPVLALSTAPSGSRRIVRTMNSRAVDSRSWPNSVEVRCATKVNAACAITTTMMTSASWPSGRPVPSTVVLTSSPSRRGTMSPATAARPLSTTSAANALRRLDSRSRKKASTSRLPATGHPRSGLRDAV